MRIHIVKRNLNLSDDKTLNQKVSNGFISQSASGRKPIGWDAEIGDQIWVHEVGYGITKYGTIINKSTDQDTEFQYLEQYLIKLFYFK